MRVSDSLLRKVAWRDFGDGLNDMVGVETGFRLEVVVNKCMHVVLPERTCRKSHLTDTITGGIPHAQGF